MVKSAPFPTDTCKECFKRTGANPDLFGDDAEPAKDDRCLDAECWKQKVQDDMNVKLIQAQKKYPTIAMVRCGYSPDANIAKLPEAGPNDWNDRMIVKKETPGAAPVFVVHGKSAGKVLWVKGGKKEEQASRATGVDGKPVPAKPHEKQQKLHNKRCAWMVAKFDTDEVKCALAELYAASDSVKQLNILLAFGSFVKRAWRSDEAWNLYSTCELGGPELRIAFLEHLAPVFVNRLSFQTLDTAEDAFVEAARICRMLGYPIFAKHYAECMAEIPKPKSFGAEVPDPWADLADPFDPKYEQPRKLSDVTKARSKKA
jgi:hypothetical protein